MAKKSFRENPALAFISEQQEDKPTTAERKQEGFKPNPAFIETKSQRVQLLLQPSVVTSMRNLAKQKGISLNEACNEAIKEYLAK